MEYEEILDDSFALNIVCYKGAVLWDKSQGMWATYAYSDLNLTILLIEMEDAVHEFIMEGFKFQHDKHTKTRCDFHKYVDSIPEEKIISSVPDGLGRFACTKLVKKPKIRLRKNLHM